MATKYQVFISSTYDDLKKEREQVIKAVLEMGHIPVGMEMFSAADEEQWKIITRQIDEVDYYAVIIAHRYGSVTSEGVSYTEKEYDYAASIGVPILGFILDSQSSWPADMIEADQMKKVALESFKQKVRGRLVNFWTARDDLYAKFSISFMKSISTNPRTGWIKSNEAVGPELIKELSRLSSENAQLRKDIEVYRKKDTDKENLKFQDTVRTLSINKKTFYVFKKGAKDWEKLADVSLLSIFEAIGPNLMVDNKTINIAGDIALYHTRDYREHWPVPSNHLSDWLADLASLELIEPSNKKRSVRDSGEYWTLSKYGKQVHHSLRKLRLQVGDSRKEEAPDDKK
jgi:hypothetical protein